jgi:hypothetical protein
MSDKKDRKKRESDEKRNRKPLSIEEKKQNKYKHMIYREEDKDDE